MYLCWVQPFYGESLHVVLQTGDVLNFYCDIIQSSKKNAGIIKPYHSKTDKYFEVIQVLKCGGRTSVSDMLSWWWVASDIETLLSIKQSIKLVRKTGRQISRAPLILPPSASRCQVRSGPCNRRLSLFNDMLK
jgi:hypothetical protein